MENLFGVPSVGAWDLPQKSIPLTPPSKVYQSQSRSSSCTGLGT